MNIFNLIKERKYKEALDIIEEELKKEDKEAYILSAEIYYMMYLDTGYEAYLHKAKERLEKINDKERLFSLYLMLGEYDKCKEIIDKVEGKEKEFLNALLLFEVEGDYSNIKKLVDDKVNIPDVYIIYSKILYQEGRYEKALEVLKKGFSVTKNKEVKKELNLLKNLLNVENPIILKCSFKDSKLVSKELIHCKSVFEFIDMIGVSYEGDIINLLIPYSSKLLDDIKDRLINLFHEGINMNEIEEMMEVCKREVANRE